MKQRLARHEYVGEAYLIIDSVTKADERLGAIEHDRRRAGR